MRDADFRHNFHTHTYRCKHATGDVDDYCRAAPAAVSDPSVAIDTNHLERALRPTPMGRKAWPFCCVPQAPHLISLLATS